MGIRHEARPLGQTDCKIGIEVIDKMGVACETPNHGTTRGVDIGAVSLRQRRRQRQTASGPHLDTQPRVVTLKSHGHDLPRRTQKREVDVPQYPGHD